MFIINVFVEYKSLIDCLSDNQKFKSFKNSKFHNEFTIVIK